MKIEDTWKSLNEAGEGLSSAEIQAGLSSKSSSMDAVQKLNKRLAWKIFFTIIFMPLYVLALFYVSSWLPQVLFGIILLAHVVGLLFFIMRYRKAKQLNLGSDNSRATLSLYIENVKATIRQEEIGGLILYPIAGASGFFLSLLEKMTLEEAMADTRIWIILGIVLLILTPLSHWLARWMNRKTFNKYLKILEERLHLLESED